MRQPDLVINGTGAEQDYLRRWWIWPKHLNCRCTVLPFPDKSGPGGEA